LGGAAIRHGCNIGVGGMARFGDRAAFGAGRHLIRINARSAVGC
jgi:hypothetical protein